MDTIMPTKNRALRDLCQFALVVWLVGWMLFGTLILASWHNGTESIFLTLIFMGYCYLVVPIFKGAKRR